jgi:hypothetical protein
MMLEEVRMRGDGAAADDEAAGAAGSGGLDVPKKSSSADMVVGAIFWRLAKRR